MSLSDVGRFLGFSRTSEALLRFGECFGAAGISGRVAMVVEVWLVVLETEGPKGFGRACSSLSFLISAKLIFDPMIFAK